MLPGSLLVKPWFEQLRVVLVRPRNPLNIGAAARAISNFGFSHLRLVTPWEPSYLGAKSAVGAAHVLETSEVFDDVASAVADCALVVGTTAAGKRELQHRIDTLEDAAAPLHAAMQQAPVALLFGSEKSGLSNEELAHCHWLMRIPTRDEHISMNLGQSVAICLYELTRGNAAPPVTTQKNAARAEDLERIAGLLLETLETSGYFSEAGEQAAMDKLRRFVQRLELNPEDARVLLGMMRQILWKVRH